MPIGVTVGDGEPLGVPVGLGLPVGVPVGLGEAVPVGEAVGLGLPFGEPVGDGEAVPDGLPVGETVGEGEPVVTPKVPERTAVVPFKTAICEPLETVGTVCPLSVLKSSEAPPNAFKVI